VLQHYTRIAHFKKQQLHGPPKLKLSQVHCCYWGTFKVGMTVALKVNIIDKHKWKIGRNCVVGKEVSGHKVCHEQIQRKLWHTKRTISESMWGYFTFRVLRRMTCPNIPMRRSTSSSGTLPCLACCILSQKPYNPCYHHPNNTPYLPRYWELFHAYN
jgi:hypothetical protein